MKHFLLQQLPSGHSSDHTAYRWLWLTITELFNLPSQVMVESNFKDKHIKNWKQTDDSWPKMTLKVCEPREKKSRLIGANGAGKSTLLKEIWKILRERTDMRVGYIPQHYGDSG